MRTALAPVATAVFLTAWALNTTQAQPGNVLSHQKISSTQGNFQGPLFDGDQFGSSVASIGDLDGDGIPDMAVGTLDDDGGVDKGSVWILFLNEDRTVKAEQKISATQGGFVGPLEDRDWFGSAVTGLGDLNGDKIPDIAVGAQRDDDGGNGRGAIYILFLNRDGTVKGEQKISDTEGNFTGFLEFEDAFGFSLTTLGDLNGDNIPDIVTGCYQDDDGGNNKGAVWILFLNRNGTVKAHQKISATEGNFEGELEIFDRFGVSVASLGDLDGDDITDLAVGAYWDDDGASGAGAVWILFLKRNGTVKAHQKISALEGNFTGELEADDRFGQSATGIRDLDGDLINDLVVGAVFDDDGDNAQGAVWVLFMNTDGTVKGHQKISETQGNFTGDLDIADQFGISCAALGDIDGDRISELAVGSLWDDDGGGARGAVYVLSLDGISTGPELSLVGNCPGLMGFKVTGATPNKSVAFVYAMGHGNLTIPQNFPCAGIQLGLNGSAKLAKIQTADQDGNALFDTSVPSKACGAVYLQVIDFDTCFTSNVVLVE